MVSFRTIAVVRATLAGFAASRSWVYFAFQIRIETSGDKRWHIESLAQAGAAATNEGASSPASRLARDRRQPDEMLWADGVAVIAAWHPK
jgi:hypothetical protein